MDAGPSGPSVAVPPAAPVPSNPKGPAWRRQAAIAGLPYAFFGAITLAAFWKFLLFGHTLYDIRFLESHLERPEQRPTGWFQPDHPHTDRGDTLLLAPLQFRVYNEGLKHGELRLWNPYLHGGYPLYANPIVHPFYPPHLLLHAALPPEAAYEVALMLHLFFSGAAMFWLLRGLGRGAAAATAGAVLWMLGGYNRTWFSAGVLEGASVFGPLALLWIVGGLERKDLRFAALAAVAMGMAILGSHAQHALHVFLFLLAWLGASAIRDRAARAFTVKFGLVFALLTLGVGMVELRARLDTISNGYRSTMGDAYTFYRDWIEVLSHLGGLVVGKVYFPDNPILEGEFTIYAGLAGSALALAGAVRGFREPGARFAAIFGASALAFAFLRPLAVILYHVPLLNLSPPPRWLFIFGWCLSILAGYGFDSLRENPGRTPRLLAGATALLLIACLIGLGPFRFSNGTAVETLIGFALAAGAAFAIRRGPRVALPLAFAALVFELVPPFLLVNFHADPRALRETPEAVKFVRGRETEPWRATGLLSSVFSSEKPPGLWEFAHGNNLLALYDVEMAGGYESVAPAHAVLFCMEANGDVTGGGRSLKYLRFASPLLDVAGISYVFMPFDQSPGERFRLVGQWGRLKVYKNTAALPRAYLVSEVLAARDQNQAAKLLKARAFDPRRSVVIETSESLPPLEGPAGGRVEWTERTPDRLGLRVSTPRPSILVLSDNDYPGWEAEVDSRSVPIFRANLAFRAVYVPAGDHTVRFRFRPESVRHGLIGSAAFLLLALAYGVTRRREDRRRDQGPVAPEARSKNSGGR